MKLYKYRPIDKHIDTIFKNNKIWLPKRKKLNDPEDILLNIINDVTPLKYKKFLQKTAKKEKWSNKILQDNYKYYFNINKFTDLAIKRIENTLKIMTTHLNIMGILSLSEDRDNYVLWKNYADNNQGICIEFEIKESEHLLKVKYAHERPKLKLSELLLLDVDEVIEMIIAVLRTKTMKWSKEYEWRYFVREGNKEFAFLGHVSGVTFGEKTTQKNKDKIIDLIKSSGNRIEIYGI